MRIILVLFGLLASVPLWAVQDCSKDVGGTFKTAQPELRPHHFIECRGCREINHHPTDIRNFMWNWAVLGRADVLPRTATGLGTYIFSFRLDQELIVTPVFGDDPGSNVMSIPVCNDHGQCATGTVTIIHNIIGIRTVRGFTLGVNVGIREVDISVTLPNGDVSSATYLASQMTSHRKRTGYKMPVPADTKADFAKSSDCLNNAGQKRPLDPEMTPANPGSSSGDYYLEDGYERWWDEEAAYGGRTPDYRCGIASISGGGSTRTCGWFWF